MATPENPVLMTTSLPLPSKFTIMPLYFMRVLLLGKLCTRQRTHVNHLCSSISYCWLIGIVIRSIAAFLGCVCILLLLLLLLLLCVCVCVCVSVCVCVRVRACTHVQLVIQPDQSQLNTYASWCIFSAQLITVLFLVATLCRDQIWTFVYTVYCKLSVVENFRDAESNPIRWKAFTVDH